MATGDRTVLFRRAERPGWWFDFTDSAGKRRRKKALGEKKRDARRWQADFLADLEFARHQQVAVPAFTTFLHTHYLALYAAQVMPATFDRAVFTFNSADAFFGHTPLDQITTAQIRVYFAGLRARQLSPATLKREFNVLAPVFDEAQEVGHIVRNPFRGGGRRRVITFESTRPREVRNLPGTELDAILDAASDKYRPIITFYVDTGVRRGQALGLEWKFVADDFSTARPPAQKRGYRPECQMSPRLRKILAHLWQHRGPAPLHGPHRVFSGVTVNGLRLYWRRFRKRVGHPTLRIQDLRVMFVSSLEGDAFRPQATARLLGHRSPRMSQTVYNRALREGELAEAPAALERSRAQPDG